MDREEIYTEVVEAMINDDLREQYLIALAAGERTLNDYEFSRLCEKIRDRIKEIESQLN